MTSVYDRRMEEIARMKEAERNGLDRIEESTQTINRGMSNPLVWLFGIGGILLVPVTGGLSAIGVLVALMIATANGKAAVQAVQPTTADLAAPREGCIRILCAAGTLIIMLLVFLLVVLIAFTNATGIPMK